MMYGLFCLSVFVQLEVMFALLMTSLGVSHLRTLHDTQTVLTERCGQSLIEDERDFFLFKY